MIHMIVACGRTHIYTDPKKKEKTCMNKLKLWFLLMGSRPRKRIQVIQQA